MAPSRFVSRLGMGRGSFVATLSFHLSARHQHPVSGRNTEPHYHCYGDAYLDDDCHCHCHCHINAIAYSHADAYCDDNFTSTSDAG